MTIFISPVSDLKRSSEFYTRSCLSRLASTCLTSSINFLGFAIHGEQGFWLKSIEVGKHLYVAFTAKRADAVRASYKAAMDAGATSNKEPSLRPEWRAPTTLRPISATRTDTTLRLPISLGSTNKRYEPSSRAGMISYQAAASFRSNDGETVPRRGPCRPRYHPGALLASFAADMRAGTVRQVLRDRGPTRIPDQRRATRVPPSAQQSRRVC